MLQYSTISIVYVSLYALCPHRPSQCKPDYDPVGRYHSFYIFAVIHICRLA